MYLTPSQAIVAKDLHRFRIVCCGRRWGKTLLALEEIKGKAIAHPVYIAYIATTYAQARDIAWDRLKKEFAPVTIQANESRLELRVRTLTFGESVITLRGWENIETLRGLSFDFIVLDEVASMRTFWAIWQEIIRPTLTDRRGEAMFISTPRGFNHFYDLYNFETKDPADFKSFHFTTYDNPHIPSDEVDKARLELTEDRFAQEYLADFRKTEGLVYKEFDRKRHLYDERPDRTMEKVLGIDFGYVNPAAVLSIYVDGENLWVEDEWYKRGKTEVQIAEYAAALESQAAYPDPESPSAVRALEDQGLNVREVVKGKDSVKSGIQRVREMLKSRRLMINRQCLNLIHEFETYTYDEDRLEVSQLVNENPKKNPIKTNDHALDALRYVVMMRQPRGSEPTGTAQEANFEVY